MTIPEAFTQLLQSEKYKELSNVIGNLRVIKTRFKKNKLSLTTQVELLEANGYVITADKVEKKSRCCGRCDGVNDICVADTTCSLHDIVGCRICWPD